MLFLLIGLVLSCAGLYYVCKWDGDEPGESWSAWIRRNVKGREVEDRD